MEKWLTTLSEFELRWNGPIETKGDWQDVALMPRSLEDIDMTTSSIRRARRKGLMVFRLVGQGYSSLSQFLVIVMI